MNRILYEASFRFHVMNLIPVFMLIWILLFPSIVDRVNRCLNLKYSVRRHSFNRAIIRVLFVFVSVILVITIIFEIDMTKKTVGAYKRGDYQIVEGYVENFHPMPYGGHSQESFEINGVLFSYSDFNSQQGYNKAKSHGGVITGDGQHLKIGYVYYGGTYGNIIIYIEELP